MTQQRYCERPVILIAVDAGVTGAWARFHGPALHSVGRYPVLPSRTVKKRSGKKKLVSERNITGGRTDFPALFNLMSQWAQEAARVILVIEQEGYYGRSVRAVVGLRETVIHWHDAAVITGAEYVPVRASRWKNELGLTKEKEDSLALVSELYSSLAGIRNHNVAEAILIGYWAIHFKKVLET